MPDTNPNEILYVRMGDNGQEYYDDGTVIQHNIDSDYVWEVADGARVLLWRGSGRSGYEIVSDDSWIVAETTNRSWHVVVPCDCPRHRGTVVYHNAGN